MNFEQELKALASRKGISRRGFMERALALGATTALATTLADRAFAAPKRGGHFRCGLGHGSTTDSLDPATFENFYMQVVGRAARSNLMEVGQNGDLLPELAEGFDVSDDARTWKFNLRRGVEFHNGKTVDANDVVASINHHRGEDSKSAAKWVLDAIVDMKADGKDAVTITLKEGNADFPFLLSNYHLAILPTSGDHRGLEIRRRHRGLRARELRARRAHHVQAQPQLLQDGVRALRRSGVDHHRRRGGAHQRADYGRDRRHGPGRSQDRAPAQAPQGHQDRRDQRHATLPRSRCGPTRRPSTTTTCGWR